MTQYVGVDGCPAGWFAVVLDGDRWQCYVYPNIQALWAALHDAVLILIDIPIGLPQTGERAAEAEARKVLGTRRSSVFGVPVRAAIYAPTYAEANEISAQATGKRISKQLWQIAPKIREVDLLLHNEPAARQKFREVHPEVLFWGLAGRPMAHAKKSRIGLNFVGLNERLEVLQSIFPEAKTIYESAVAQFPRHEVVHDDILDALAAALVAKLDHFKTLPLIPERDAYGLPMEMVYTDNVKTEPRVMRLHHAQITIPKGAESQARAFYCEVLGLREIPKPESLQGRGGFWVEVGDQQLHIGTEDGVDRNATKAHLAYQVTHITQWREKLTQHGIRIEEQIPIPGLNRFEFRDPFGNRVEFTEPQ